MEFLVKADLTTKLIFFFFMFSTLGSTVWFLRWTVLQFIAVLKTKNIKAGELIISDNHQSLTHKDCSKVREMVSLFTAQQIVLNKIFHIRDREILTEQMSFAENKTDLILSLSENRICELLQKNNPKDYLHSAEYIAFKALSELIKEKVLIKFRHMCKENHFLEKEEMEFKEYVGNHTRIIHDMIMQYNKSFFPYYDYLDGYKESLITNTPEIKKYIEDTIVNAREVSKKKSEDINKLLNEFEVKYEQIVGEKPMRISL